MFILILGVVGTGIANILFYKLIHMSSPVFATTVTYLIPIVAFFWGLLDNEVITSQNNFTTAIQAMDFQKKNMELAEKVYQQTKKKYEIGTGSQTEINAAQADLKAAQTNYITALYEASIAKIDFLRAIGKL